MGSIRIGARVEQPRRELEVTVGHGYEKRRRTGSYRTAARQRAIPLHRLARRRRVHVDARPEQRLRHLDPAFSDREQKRCVAGVEGRVRIGADFEQQLDDLQVALCDRPHECRLAAPRLAEVDIGAGLVERFHDLDPAGPRRGHEHRLAAGQHRVRVGAAGKERFDDFRIAVRAGQGQRDDAVAIGRRGVGAGVEQALGEVFAVVVHGPVQGGHPVDLGDVDGVGGWRGSEEAFEGRGVEPFGGVGEGGSGGCGGCGRG